MVGRAPPNGWRVELARAAWHRAKHHDRRERRPCARAGGGSGRKRQRHYRMASAMTRTHIVTMRNLSCSLAAALLSSVAGAQNRPATLVLTNGHIVTVDSARPE